MITSSIENSPVVLVVDDDALVRLDTADFLEDAGFKIVVAKDAAAALKIMKTRSDITILFTDVQMPGFIDGIELAEQIHEHWPDVILLITSRAAWPPERSIPNHGHFLSKPYRPAVVINELHALAQEAAARRCN